MKTHVNNLLLKYLAALIYDFLTLENDAGVFIRTMTVVNTLNQDNDGCEHAYFVGKQRRAHKRKR